MRVLRLLSLLWALPAALWGAQVARPIQLALDFTAPLAAAPLPAALGAVPPSPNISGIGGNLPASAAVAPSLAAPQASAVPEPVAWALKGGDAHAFYRAVSASGYEVPAGDDHQQRLLKEGWERAAADRAFFDGQAKAAKPQAAPTVTPAAKRATKLDYEAFGRMLGLSPRLAESPLRDTEAKRRILMAAGYTHLIGPGGRRIPLSIADEARVGRAFEHTKKTYLRRK